LTDETGVYMAAIGAVRVQRPSWANVRTALGLVLFCVALVAGQRLISNSQGTVPVWVAARDLPADTVLGAGDLRAEEVRLPAELEGNYVSASTSIDGRPLARPILEGEIVAGSALGGTDEETNGRIMTLSADVLGQGSAAIGLGDRIDVIATFDPGDVRSRTVPVVLGAEVVEVVTSQGFVGESDVAGLSIDVPEELVGKLSFAASNAELDVVKVSGEVDASGTWSVTRADFE
jgi:Flp pilus assembly protein CpaB